jgi:hypothetical protein
MPGKSLDSGERMILTIQNVVPRRSSRHMGSDFVRYNRFCFVRLTAVSRPPLFPSPRRSANLHPCTLRQIRIRHREAPRRRSVAAWAASMPLRDAPIRITCPWISFPWPTPLRLPAQSPLPPAAGWRSRNFSPPRPISPASPRPWRPAHHAPDASGPRPAIRRWLSPTPRSNASRGAARLASPRHDRVPHPPLAGDHGQPHRRR